MKKFFCKNYYYLIILLFIFISCFTMLMCGDDYIWFFTFDDDRLITYRSENGRYLTNIITRFEMKSEIFFDFFYIIVFFSMIFLMAKIFKSKVSSAIASLSIFLLVNSIPASTYRQVIRWKSAFPNYCLGAVITFIFMIFVFKILFENYKPKKYTSVLLLITGFLGSLCVEHVTVYNLFFSVFAIVMLYVDKKPKLYAASFFIGSLVGAVLMFTHPQYHVIANEGDNLGMRNFGFSLVDMFMQIYQFIIPSFCKNFILVHIILSVSFVVLYYKTPEQKKTKYTLPSVIVCILFSLYSFFTSDLQDFINLNGAMKTSSIELAFTFIYFCTLIYNIVFYLSGSNRIRALVFLFSTLILTAPFLVVSPVTYRCFFNEYLFWILFALEVFFFTFNDTKIVFSKIFEKCLISLSIAIVFIFANMNITNFYYDKIRYDYIREQVADHKKNVDAVLLPYANYVCDDLTDGDSLFLPALDNDVSYGEYIMKYYGISYDADNMFKFKFISVMDYNNLMGN